MSANTSGAKFFHSCLINTQYGKQGLAYLAGRGIGDAIIASFELGMAPPDFSTLHEALEQRGVKEAVLLKAGLVVARSHSSGVYDKFRERIMIHRMTPGSCRALLTDSLMHSPLQNIYEYWGNGLVP